MSREASDDRNRGGTSGAEEAAWRELVSRLELPSYIDPRHAPWPDRENLSGTGPGTGAGPGSGPAGSGAARVIRPATSRPVADAGDSAAEPVGGDDPDDGEFSDGWLFDDDESADRYIPPPVPPLPALDPVAKGAWAALFGGPGYLFLATLFGWQVPGWAELAALIAFVTGFSLLVIRLGDGPSRRDGPDQGAML